MKKNFWDILLIVTGSVIFAFSVAWLASPVGLVTGGVSGIGIIIKELSGGFIPIYITSFILNIPLFAVCTLQRGFKFIGKSSLAFLAVTLALSVFENIPSPLDFEGDILMSAVLYGIASGIGLGMILRSGATSGGTDMLAAIIKHKNPSLPISKLIVIIDIIIISAGVFTFNLRISLYAILSLVISAKAIDIVLSGPGVSKTVFIISEKSKEIANQIFIELERGTTSIDAVGMYTGEKRKMLMVVISSRELSVLRKIVSDLDARAFLTVSDAKQVLGEGFDNLFISSDSLN